MVLERKVFLSKAKQVTKTTMKKESKYVKNNCIWINN